VRLQKKKKIKKEGLKKSIEDCAVEFCSFHEQLNFLISGNGVKISSSKTLKKF